MFRHIKDLVELDDSGPKAWKLLRDVIQPNTLSMVIVLEKELAALSMRPGDDVKPVLDKIMDTYARMAAAGSNVSQMTNGHLSGYGDRFCRRTSAGAQQVVVLPTKLLRGMELQEAAEEEGEGEAEAVGEALAEGEAKVTTTRGMGALCFSRLEGWAPPGMKPPSDERARGGAVQGSGAQAHIGADFEAVLKKKGIQHQLTVPYNPQQNGVAERFNRTLQEGARTLLGRAGLPDPFWVTALRQVALVKNRVLATVGDKQWVPYTKWYGSAPAVNMLRAYGCMVVFHVPKEKKGKLEASGRWGVHLGLAKDHKG
ncbi:unnamed protein product [Closterium sp. NIES-53]